MNYPQIITILILFCSIDLYQFVGKLKRRKDKHNTLFYLLKHFTPLYRLGVLYNGSNASEDVYFFLIGLFSIAPQLLQVLLKTVKRLHIEHLYPRPPLPLFMGIMTVSLHRVHLRFSPLSL